MQKTRFERKNRPKFARGAYGFARASRMRSGTAILDIAPSFDTFIDGLSVDPDYVLGVKWLRKLSRLPPNILLTSNGRSSAGQDVEAQFCVSGKARTLREPDDVTKFRSSLNVKENRRMMTLMPRREFLQAGAGAAWAIAHPAWATWSGTVNAIRPPGKEFLATLPHLMELAKLPGLGMGVVEGGKMAWQHYSGVANATTNAPITAESLFPAASMGKQVFAYGVILLAQQGKLDLDTPLKGYLADGAPTGRWSEKITARHVLSHSSGLPNWRWDKDQELTPAFEPGTKFRYSGEGFYFLQRCVEHITAIGGEQWIQDRIMKPLGMKSSTYLWSADADARIVAGHQGDEPSYNTEFVKKLFLMIEASGNPLVAWRHEEIVAAMLKDKPPGTKLLPNEISPNVAFSLLTTVADYSTFLAHIVSQRNDLTPEMRAAIRKPISRINSALGWALGFGIEQEGVQPPYLWQWGDNGGWKNFFLAQPESQSAIVVFTNGENGMHIAERVLRAATGDEQVAFLWI